MATTWKQKEGESSYGGNLRKVKFIKMAEGMLKWDFLWVGTTWKVFFLNVKDHSSFLDPNLNRKKHTKLTRENRLTKQIFILTWLESRETY